MPRLGYLWRHTIINTKSTWLHGDARGFRSRDHRIHSSGDYKHPPPRGEHAALHHYMKRRAKKEVHIPHECRPVVGRAIIQHLNSNGYRVLALAVGKVHTHFLPELPHELEQVRLIVGEAKKVSSRAVKKQLPGTAWAEGGTYKPVLDRAHERSAHDYILYEQGPDAWTWSYRDGSYEGMFGRKRPARSASSGAALRSAPAWRQGKR